MTTILIFWLVWIGCCLWFLLGLGLNVKRRKYPRSRGGLQERNSWHWGMRMMLAHGFLWPVALFGCKTGERELGGHTCCFVRYGPDRGYPPWRSEEAD